MSLRAFTRRYLVSLVALLLLVAIVNTADKDLLAPVADAVRADLGMNDTQLGAVRSAVFLAALLGQFLWGPLSDRWVRKYVIALGAVLLMLGLGVVVYLALLRTVRRDMEAQQALVKSQISHA